ncbi:hypothetical protein [Sandaracinus amylolyticus]|uniref:hypothetical protein n=1 Tax=Sandaracinus amylolyticus TaxID=927083 RepID=UPI001F175A14|nr:hypothetical protein [Sandaracinus amylolyticus]UJR86495.1 Hypothetical protein I5071_85900 [Sandaracinus amylolyticus]
MSVHDSAPAGLPLPSDLPPATPPARPGVFSMKNPTPAEQIKSTVDVKPVVDDRLASIERLVGRNQWADVCALLAPEPGSAERLPPALALVYAVALKESSPDVRDADRRAIGAVADLLGITRESPLALVLGKRLTRRRNWAETPAPSKTVSTVVVLGGLAIGTIIGWLVTYWMF